MRLVASLQRIGHIVVLNSGIDVGGILSNCIDALVALPTLLTCAFADASNHVHMQTVGIVVVGRNNLCPLPVDGVDMWKHHKLCDLVVRA